LGSESVQRGGRGKSTRERGHIVGGCGQGPWGKETRHTRSVAGKSNLTPFECFSCSPVRSAKKTKKKKGHPQQGRPGQTQGQAKKNVFFGKTLAATRTEKGSKTKKGDGATKRPKSARGGRQGPSRVPDRVRIRSGTTETPGEKRRRNRPKSGQGPCK